VVSDWGWNEKLMWGGRYKGQGLRNGGLGYDNFTGGIKEAPGGKGRVCRATYQPIG